uniref:TMhelix containing protein n=1 Tax=Mesocestoides corti TaxID=53468 RepID=A0A5K3G5A2_MESCO
MRQSVPIRVHQAGSSALHIFLLIFTYLWLAADLPLSLFNRTKTEDWLSQV